jgi:GxxExxY protein
MIHEKLSGRIIQGYYKVYHILGYGFLEKVYENALRIELQGLGLSVLQQRRVEVYYEGLRVGDYFADLCINEIAVLELKAADCIAPIHEAQLINYLKATEMELGFVLNFGPKPQFIRRIYTNDRKIINHG